MADIKDGGGAFPLTPFDGYDAEPGMSLRDWFAGKALPAIIAATSHGVHDAGWGVCGPESTVEQRMAYDAYAMADAMIAERYKAAGETTQ